MNHIAADVHRQITTDRAGLGLEGLGGADQLAGAGDHAVAFPHHRHHRTAGDELHQAGEEGTLAMHAVVAFSQLAAGGELLEAHQLEALALEAAEDLAHQAPLHAVGLDGDEGAFDGHGFGAREWKAIVRAGVAAWQAGGTPDRSVFSSGRIRSGNNDTAQPKHRHRLRPALERVPPQVHHRERRRQQGPQLATDQNRLVRELTGE